MDFLLFKYCTPDRAVQTPQWQTLRVCAATSTSSTWMHLFKLFSDPLGKMLGGWCSLMSSIKPEQPAPPPLLLSQQSHPVLNHLLSQFPCVTPHSSPWGRGEHNHFKRQYDTNHGPPSPQVPTSARSAGTARPGVCTFVSLCPQGARGSTGMSSAPCSPSPVAVPTGQAPGLILQQRTWVPCFCPNASPKTCWNTRKPCTWAPEETVLSDLFIF